MIPVNVIKSRLKRVQQSLQGTDGGAALLVSSAAEIIKTRDLYYPYRQNSDFYYLTGSELRGALLLLSSKRKKPLLIASPTSASTRLWEGKFPSPKRLAEELDCEIIFTKNRLSDTKRHLLGADTLYFGDDPRCESFQIAKEIISLPSHRVQQLPRRLARAGCVLDQMRLIKDPSEVALIVKAAQISAQAMNEASRMLRAGVTEQRIAEEIDHSFRSSSAEPAFATIVAGGSNAATLHHRPSSRRLKRGELVLIDWGAEVYHYCSDTTRVFPVGGTFSPELGDLYQVVLDAQQAAIKTAKAGVSISKVYDTACKKMAQGLKDMRIFNGSQAGIIKNPKFKKLFPHSIGHSLGIDVHDVGDLRDSRRGILQKGMVLTIEPGLYFSRRTKSIPACGIRIEDDILVGEKSSEVLTKMIPKAKVEIENLLAG